MADVAELEKRIAAALDRIGAGLSALSAAGSPGGSSGGSPDGDADELASLQEILETERTANAQLEQRVVAIKEKQEKLVAMLEAEVARLREETAAGEAAVQNVKRVNHRLRENNRALREANRQGVGDAELINAGMVAELDALRATHDSDRAELDAILVELKPLVEGGANA
jgi:galactokinase